MRKTIGLLLSVKCCRIVTVALNTFLDGKRQVVWVRLEEVERVLHNLLILTNLPVPSATAIPFLQFGTGYFYNAFAELRSTQGDRILTLKSSPL